MSNAATQLVEELVKLFPDETQGYEQLIQDCVEHIIDELPPNMNVGQYVAMVRQNIQAVRDGQRKAGKRSTRQSDQGTDRQDQGSR